MVTCGLKFDYDELKKLYNRGIITIEELEEEIYSFGKYYGTPCIMFLGHIPYRYSKEWHEHWVYIHTLGVYRSNVSML